MRLAAGQDSSAALIGEQGIDGSVYMPRRMSVY
jgi:hypothetical protein